MHSLLYIADRIVKNNNNPIENFAFMLLKNPYKIKDKFGFFNQTMTNNFFNAEMKEHFLSTFCKIQQTYFAFSRLCRIWKLKYGKFVVTADLGMNELSLENKNVMCILHDNKNYLFSIRDLITLIETSLLNNYCFFSLPLAVKNPYNNIPFNKSTLYNIYYFIRFNTDLYPELLFHFFNANFNIAIFGRKYEYLLREISVDKYVKNTDTDSLHGDVKDMIHLVLIRNKYKITIHKDFPKPKLVEIMRPYLQLWYSAFYSLIPIKQQSSMKRLVRKLIKFIKFNPQFGRRYVKIDTKYVNGTLRHIQTVCYNDTHKPFIVEDDDFLTNHIQESE